jgi:hypothetical protein
MDVCKSLEMATNKLSLASHGENQWIYGLRILDLQLRLDSEKVRRFKLCGPTISLSITGYKSYQDILQPYNIEWVN